MRISDWSSDVCSSDLDGLSGFVEVRLGSVYPAEAGLTVGENARNRLIDLVGNRCGELGHGGDPRDPGQVSLRAMHLLFRKLRGRDVHDYPGRNQIGRASGRARVCHYV